MLHCLDDEIHIACCLTHSPICSTDLNWVTDPFTKDQREWFSDLLNRRFSPILERIYGVPQSAIRGLDLFVVRYDEGIRTHLQRHTDDGHLSFVILLNDEFEGGGTRVSEVIIWIGEGKGDPDLLLMMILASRYS